MATTLPLETLPAEPQQPRTVIRPNSPHPGSYRPDLPLRGYRLGLGQMTRNWTLTKEERAQLAKRPLVLKLARSALLAPGTINEIKLSTLEAASIVPVRFAPPPLYSLKYKASRDEYMRQAREAKAAGDIRRVKSCVCDARVDDIFYRRELQREANRPT